MIWRINTKTWRSMWLLTDLISLPGEGLVHEKLITFLFHLVVFGGMAPVLGASCPSMSPHGKTSVSCVTSDFNPVFLKWNRLPACSTAASNVAFYTRAAFWINAAVAIFIPSPRTDGKELPDLPVCCWLRFNLQVMGRIIFFFTDFVSIFMCVCDVIYKDTYVILHMWIK